MALKLTPSGTDLLLRAIAGEVNIKFTAIQLGNGADAGKSAAALSNPLLTAEISSYEVGDVFVTLRTTFSNSQVSASFRATEVGVLAHDPDTADGTLLYAYQYTPEGESDYIPASADKVLETQMDVLVYIGDAENVTASISQSLVYASRAELEAHVQNKGNPHEVTAEQVGLGHVSNVSTNDQTPTYTEASALVGLKSGEKLSISFGKIAKAVSSLIAHTKNGENPHKVTAEQVGAAKSSHKHSTNDLTGGVLGVARGGTGVTGYDRLKEKLGVNCKIERVRSNYSNLTFHHDIYGIREHTNYEAYGNDTFVAIGDKALFDHTPIMYVSKNGVIYDKVDVGLPNEFFNGIVFGGGLFVAVFESKVIYSKDGRSWTTVSLDKKLFGAHICFGIDTFMIVAAEKGVNVCYTSKDAATWTAHDMPSVHSEAYYTGLCYGDGKFVAITASGYVEDTKFTVSNDKGDTWSALKMINGMRRAKHLIYAHGKYVTVTEAALYQDVPRIAISRDLSTWDVLDKLAGDFLPEVIGITNTGFCAYGKATGIDGDNSKYYFSSEDGYTWNRSTKAFVSGSAHFLHAKGITWAFDGSDIAASSDGDSWTNVFYKLYDGSIITIGPMKGE